MEVSEFRVHGGPPYAELAALGLDCNDVVDFSANTNIYGPCPGMLEAVRAAAIHSYPDSTARRAREALARAFDENPNNLVLGNGAADLLWTLARILVPPGSKALIVEPTFCEFRAACVANRLPTTEWRADEHSAFAIDLTAISARARADGANAVYLCSPNTPTGATVRAAEVASWAAENPRLQIILDQSFLTLSDHADDVFVRMSDNVVRVRSLTKDHAIPGIRVAYAIASEKIVTEIERTRPAWTVSSMAQAAAIAASQQAEFVVSSRSKLLDDCRQLQQQLRDLGLAPLASSTVFLLTRIEAVAQLKQRLLSRHRILIRDCASFGLPNHARLAARSAPDRARLLQALREELGQC